MPYAISREGANIFPLYRDFNQENIASETRRRAVKMNACSSICCVGLLLAMVGMCDAQVFSEDFNDGNDDGWIPHEVTFPGHRDVIGGVYQLTTDDSVPVGNLGHVISRFNTDSPIGDGVLRAKVSANTQGTSAGIALFSSDDPAEYYVFNGSSESGGFNLWRSNGQTFLPNLLESDRLGQLRGLSPFKTGDEWWLELGLVEGVVSAKAWPDGNPIPDLPQLTFVDSNPHPIAEIAVAGWISTAWTLPTQVSASFDDISFSPISHTNLECDFDGDGSLGVGDLNLLLAQIATGPGIAAFDLNGDELVDTADLNLFVSSREKLNTWIGDTNLDGEFNSTDFVLAFQSGLYETGQPAQWQQGDWNGDGEFSSGDLVVAFQAGGFEKGRRLEPVPEPCHGAACGLVFATLAMHALRRRNVRSL